MHSNFWVFQKDGDILFRALKRFYCSPSSSSNTLVNFTIQATRFMKYLQRSLNFLLLFTTTHSEFKMSFQILWFFQLTARKMRKNRPPCILFRIYLAPCTKEFIPKITNFSRNVLAVNLKVICMSFSEEIFDWISFHLRSMSGKAAPILLVQIQAGRVWRPNDPLFWNGRGSGLTVSSGERQATAATEFELLFQSFLRWGFVLIITYLALLLKKKIMNVSNPPPQGLVSKPMFQVHYTTALICYFVILVCVSKILFLYNSAHTSIDNYCKPKLRWKFIVH